jgi:hypothetical protein
MVMNKNKAIDIFFIAFFILFIISKLYCITKLILHRVGFSESIL